VRDLLAHASITTTERYDNQTAEALKAAAQCLESGKTFTNPSHEGAENKNPQVSSKRRNAANTCGIERLKIWLGVRDEFRNWMSFNQGLIGLDT
jgi:hypothetical protein